MAAVPVSVTGALPITVVPVLLDSLVGPMLTASPAEADSRDDAGRWLRTRRESRRENDSGAAKSLLS